MRTLPFATALIATCAFLSVSAYGNEYYQPVVGETHADFVLPRIDNRQPVWLSQFRGQKVLLIQFASW